MSLDDFQELNSFMANEYKPETLMLQAPDKTIWEALKEDNINKEKELEKERHVKKFEASDSSSSKNSSTSSSSKASSYSSYSSYSPYSSYSSYSSKEKSSEEAVEKDFDKIREKAFKIADEELSRKEAPCKIKTNPQLDILMGKKVPIKSKVKNMFTDGSMGKKALLVCGMIFTKGIAMMLYDAKNKKKE